MLPDMSIILGNSIFYPEKWSVAIEDYNTHIARVNQTWSELSHTKRGIELRNSLAWVRDYIQNMRAGGMVDFRAKKMLINSSPPNLWNTWELLNHVPLHIAIL